MPWSVAKPPSVAKNWTTAEKKKCVTAANAVLADGGSEEDAIFACIRAAGKSKKQSGVGMARQKDVAAQQDRSRRYSITIREDGNFKPPAELPDSEWGDPVNYYFPVTDKKSAKQAQADFADIAEDTYKGRSLFIIRGRINRLARKYGVGPILNEEPDAVTLSDTKYEGTHRFYAVMQMPEIEEETDPHYGLVRIPAARNTVLQHPWWGAIYLDDDLFQSFIDNWSTNLIGFDLSIDADHDTSSGALAWVKDVTYDGEKFELWVDPTSLGYGQLGDVWRYASIEFLENYRDPETGADYGPTLMGCAATNRPFVHRQNAISVLSSSSPGCTDLECSLITNSVQGVGEMTTEVLFDGADEEGIVDGGQEGPGNDDLDDIQAQAAMLNQPEPTPATEPAEAQEPEPTQPVTPQPSQPVQARQFSDQDVAAILAQNAKLLARDRERTIAEACEKALARGVAPAVVEVARQVLSATEPLAEATISLSVPADGQATNKVVNLFGAVAELLNLVPGRISDPALSYQFQAEEPTTEPIPDNPYLNREIETVEEAEEAARNRRKELGIRYDRNIPGATGAVEM